MCENQISILNNLNNHRISIKIIKNLKRYFLKLKRINQYIVNNNNNNYNNKIKIIQCNN
jgi:hypothetical protein